MLVQYFEHDTLDWPQAAPIDILPALHFEQRAIGIRNLHQLHAPVLAVVEDFLDAIDGHQGRSAHILVPGVETGALGPVSAQALGLDVSRLPQAEVGDELSISIRVSLQ